MSIFTKISKALNLKALAGKVRFPGQSLIFFGVDTPNLDELARQVGDGTSADVLMSPIRWLQRAIVEAPIVAQDEEGEPIDLSDLIALLETPNPFYSWEVLAEGTVLSLSTAGNAYWIAALNEAGLPVELHYAPHTNVEPKWPDSDNTKFTTYYEYSVKGQTQKIRAPGVEDKSLGGVVVEKGLIMIHFRRGVDLDNIRKGLSPLKGLLREVWTDNEAAIFSAALLRNNGIPGVVFSPANPGDTLTPEEGTAAENKIKAKFTGEGRGSTLVMLGPTKIEQFGFSPKEMDLSFLRDISEERVTAALGVPAAVVGFGSGLQQTSVGATMRELRQLAWTNGVIPLQRIIAGEITRTLAPMFNVAKVEFDNLGVEALRENQDTKAKRIEGLVRAGIFTRAEGRVALGEEAKPGDDVYLMSMATIEVLQGEIRPTERTEELRAWAQDYLMKQGSHGLAEERIIEAAPKRKPTAAAVAMLRRLDRVRRTAGEVMAPSIEDVFNDLGEEALRAAREVLGEGVSFASDKNPGELKQDELTAADIAAAEAILESIDVAAAQVALRDAIETGYAFIATETFAGIEGGIGIEFVLDDAVQQSVMRAGGLQAGLIDLDAQTREAVFDALAEGRAEGLTADNLARRIRGTVEAGPWQDAATRARVIARTEGANAANISTLEAARAMPETEHVQVFDNRSGFDDPECVEANGAIVTIQEAETMGLAHPNCTRAFVPINALLMEEMGL